MAHNKETYISKKNVYDTKIGAINYLVEHTVYSNEWTGKHDGFDGGKIYNLVDIIKY